MSIQQRLLILVSGAPAKPTRVNLEVITSLKGLFRIPTPARPDDIPAGGPYEGGRYFPGPFRSGFSRPRYPIRPSGERSASPLENDVFPRCFSVM